MCTINWQLFVREELVLIAQKIFPETIFLTLFEGMSTDITHFSVGAMCACVGVRERETYFFTGFKPSQLYYSFYCRYKPKLQEIDFISGYEAVVTLSSWIPFTVRSAAARKVALGWQQPSEQWSPFDTLNRLFIMKKRLSYLALRPTCKTKNVFKSSLRKHLHVTLQSVHYPETI